MAQQMTLQQARQAFFQSANLRSQVLPRQQFNANAPTLEFVLPKAGYGAWLMLDFQGTLTVAGEGGSINFSKKAPYNLFQNVVFQDFLGTTRVSASGYGLYKTEIAKRLAYDPSNAIDPASYSSMLQEYSVGGAGGAAGSYPLNTSVIVPISLHEQDTRGSFPFAVPQGQNTLSVTIGQMGQLVGANLDSLLVQDTAGFTVTLSGTVGVTYYYWDVPAGTALPSQDFALIHEIKEIRETDNLSAGEEKLYTLPTGRTYFMILQDLVINGELDTTDVNRIRFLLDGSTPLLDEPLYAYLRRVRAKYGRDMTDGLFYFDFWRKQWTPNDYGSLQTGLTIQGSANVTGTTYTSVLTESLYQANNVVVG